MIDWNDRQWLATPEEMSVLEQVATQPGNCRSRKPARLIWLYTRGASKSEILADLRKSETTLERYFEMWIDYGVPGLTRMCHLQLYRDMPDQAERKNVANCY